MPMKTRYTTVNGEIIAEKRNGVRHEYVPDPLGSTVALLDNTQTQTDTFVYWPYGEVRTRTGTTPTPFQFVGTTGYYSEMNTLRTYVRARYLYTQNARWLTEDPIGFAGKDLNLYRYARNLPSILTDPSGLFIPPLCIACGLCVGVIAIGVILACADDPQGYIHCILCYCETQPILCAVIGGACLTACVLCVPELGPIFGPKPVPVPIGAGGPALGIAAIPPYDGFDEPHDWTREECQEELNLCLEQGYVGDCGCCFRFCTVNYYWPNTECYPKPKRRRKKC
jgi:RHS repeat-associated protein